MGAASTPGQRSLRSVIAYAIGGNFRFRTRGPGSFSESGPCLFKPSAVFVLGKNASSGSRPSGGSTLLSCAAVSLGDELARVIKADRARLTAHCCNYYYVRYVSDKEPHNDRHTVPGRPPRTTEGRRRREGLVDQFPRRQGGEDSLDRLLPADEFRLTRAG